MKKIAFVDVDGVLFDITAFKLKYFEFLASLMGGGKGATESVLASYEKSKSCYVYDVEKHLALLQSHIPTFFFRQKVANFVHDTAEQFIYSDVELFLSRLVGIGYEVRIATSGFEWFQKEKIPSYLKKYLTRVSVTTDATKVSIIGRFADPKVDDIVLFDDSTHVIDKVKDFFPWSCAVQVSRQKNLLGSSLLCGTAFADFHVRNLEEALHAITNRHK